MSLDLLPNFALDARREISGAFLAKGIKMFHQAACYVWDLPYGRNSDRSDWRLVLEEECGTCSTKHALLAELGSENGAEVSLYLGIYEMNEENTSGVGVVLRRYGLACIPEAHCYLKSQGNRVDLTRSDGLESERTFLCEEEITPADIGNYKVEVHRDFVRDWAEERTLSFDSVWKAREECIAALSSGD